MTLLCRRVLLAEADASENEECCVALAVVKGKGDRERDVDRELGAAEREGRMGMCSERESRRDAKPPCAQPTAWFLRGELALPFSHVPVEGELAAESQEMVGARRIGAGDDVDASYECQNIPVYNQ